MIRFSVAGLLVLGACTTTRSVSRAPKPVQLAVRLAEARHADQVEQDIFVWPTAPPTEAPDKAECMWWSGDRRGRDVAIEGLGDGSLRWAALVVTRSELSFGGQSVVALDGAGRLPEDQVTDGVISSLSGVLRQARTTQDAWYEACELVYRDRPLLVVDQAVPATTVLAILRTLAVNRFPRVAAMVGDRQPENRGLEPPEDPGVLAVVRPRGETVHVHDSLGLRRVEGPMEELESMVARVTPDARFGCALVVPETGSRWRELVATVDTVTAFGAESALVHSESEWTAGPEATSESGRAPTEWLTLDGRAAVHWLDAPELEPVWAPVTEAIRCDAVDGRVRKHMPVPATLSLALQGPGDDVVQPCLGPSCVPLPAPLPDDPVPDEPVAVGWTVHGALDLPAPDAEEGPLVAWVDRLQACETPSTLEARAIVRAVGWVEIDATGQAREPRVGVLDPQHRAWAQCLGEALKAMPKVGPPEGGTHAAVEIRVDAEIASTPDGG